MSLKDVNMDGGLIPSTQEDGLNGVDGMLTGNRLGNTQGRIRGKDWYPRISMD